MGLGQALARHDAGDSVDVPADLLFHRATDRSVRERTGKRPLEVGADRIARTAHAALLLLGHLRRALQEPVPLAWGIPLPARVAAIEVYPAATLLARGASLRGYKKRESVAAREALLPLLADALELDHARSASLAEPDCFDALACVVAGVDFIEGRAVPPESLDIAKREGWIWCP